MPHRGALTPFEPELNDKPRGPRRALGAVTGGRQSGGSHGQRGGHGKSLTTIVGGAILDLGPVGALGLHVSAQTPRSAAALTVGFRHVTTKHLHEVVACGLSLRRRARADPARLRRTAVRNLERAGVPRSTAMAMVGHRTEAIYRRYAIVDEVMLREGAAKLAAYAVTARV